MLGPTTGASYASLGWRSRQTRGFGRRIGIRRDPIRAIGHSAACGVRSC